MRVELAVCSVLLGRSREAELALCLLPSMPEPADQAVQEFVLVSTSHPGPPCSLHVPKNPPAAEPSSQPSRVRDE